MAETYLCRHFERVDFVQWDDGDAFLEAPVKEELFPDELVFDDNIVQLSPRGNLQRSRLVEVLWGERDECRHEALDLAPIEVGCR